MSLSATETLRLMTGHVIHAQATSLVTATAVTTIAAAHARLDEVEEALGDHLDDAVAHAVADATGAADLAAWVAGRGTVEDHRTLRSRLQGLAAIIGTHTARADLHAAVDGTTHALGLMGQAIAPPGTQTEAGALMATQELCAALNQHLANGATSEE